MSTFDDEYEQPLSFQELRLARLEAIAEEQLKYTKQVAQHLRSLITCLAIVIVAFAVKSWL